MCVFPVFFQANLSMLSCGDIFCRWEVALAILNAMYVHKLQPDVVTVNVTQLHEKGTVLFDATLKKCGFKICTCQTSLFKILKL